ncbi:uncharacterized protein LOC104451683 [Eucalyptus grandis]|uniref:uncharacterized protein LOC104451683 n=1 Tax=Eucalyptus grandis TaxID=71139 RepID=UPI00192ECB31|nr:uncharacterized protein LOC104451683 [Eucalyptus grandis]
MASERQTFSAKWTKSVTNLFIGLLVDEVKKGNRTSSTFNKAGWRNIHIEFIRQTGCQYSMVQLRNKENVEWAKFRKDGFPQYPELCIVFGGTYATGEYGFENAQDLTVSEEDHNGDGNVGGDNSGCNAYGDNSGGNAYGDAGGDHTDDFSDHHTDERVFTSDNAATSTRGKHKLDRTPNTKRRRKSTQNSIYDTCKAIQDFLTVRSSQFGSGSAASGVMPSPVDPFSVAAVMDILISIVAPRTLRRSPQAPMLHLITLLIYP